MDYYIKLIKENKLEELANIDKLSDLTSVDYENKYLLEFLLEKNIHSKKMDEYFVTNDYWIDLYFKYKIKDALVNLPLNRLLSINYRERNHELYLDTLLKMLDNEEIQKLLKNIKSNYYLEYRKQEPIIISSFAKVGIELPMIFISLPIILGETTDDLEFNILINKFKEIFKETNEIVLNAFISCFIHYSKINYQRATNDINKIIEENEKYPKTRLSIKEFKPDLDQDIMGFYNWINDELCIHLYGFGTFFHELSHLLFQKYERRDDIKPYVNSFVELQTKLNNNETNIKVISYLKTIKELIIKSFEDGCISYNKILNTHFYRKKYTKLIKLDLLKFKPKKINFYFEGTHHFGQDQLDNLTELMIIEDAKEYIDKYNLMKSPALYQIQTFLNALYNGKYHDNKEDIGIYCGHSKEYLTINNGRVAFNECLAAYYSIINSDYKYWIINSLREILGNEIIDLFDDYIENIRDKNMKQYKR